MCPRSTQHEVAAAKRNVESLLRKIINFHVLFILSSFLSYSIFMKTIQNQLLKVACRVQIWKKIFCQNSAKFGYSFI